jgi:hypothetical protein
MHIEKLDSYWREPISEATRTLLCDFGAGDLARPLSRLDVDWEEVFQGVCRNGLLGLTHRYLRHWEPQDYPPPEFRHWSQQAYRTSTMRMMLMYDKIGKVLAQLAGSGIDYMALKGPALAHMVYPDPSLRAFNDLDLAVRERDWAAMHRLLVDMGFKSEKDLPRPPPKLVPEAILYELRYWHRETGFLVEVHYDDLLYAGLASRDVEGLWQRAVWVDIEGVPVKALSLEDQLIQLCAHAHCHGYGRLSWFSDMAFIVRDHSAQLDWQRLLKTVQTEETQVAVYYTLRVLERLLDIDMPKDMLIVLRPDTFRRWFHERYMPEDKVLSLQPMSVPLFSFYFRPFLKRLLPDLLVMGRRREKLHYLWRLLTPPRDWLIHHYSLDRSGNILVHYLLHPAKFFFHIVTDVLSAITRAVSRTFRRAADARQILQRHLSF